MQDIQVYIQRRNRLIKSLATEGLVVIPNNTEIIRNGDSHYQYRFDSFFYYLTGFNEPNAALVIDITNSKTILFCQDKDKEREIWDGFRYGPKASQELFATDEAYSITSFEDKLRDLLVNKTNLYYTLGYNKNYDLIMIEALNQVKSKIRSGIESPTNIIDINKYISKLRLYKDEFDIKMLRRSCEIASLAHINAMQHVAKSSSEYQIEAKLLESFYSNGARYPAYTPIVASGANSCILHYAANVAPLTAGDILLVDAGCEYLGYASDITRSYPINGQFTKAQQAIYEIVLEANKQAIKAIKIGEKWSEPGAVALKILIQGLIDLNLLKGSVEDNIQNQAYRQFYMHGIGHYLGLDVHDAGEYKLNGEWIEFNNGICNTIEPGIYIQPAENVPEQYWNIGIRIEDDILINDDKVEVLTSGVPKEITDIEHLILNK